MTLSVGENLYFIRRKYKLRQHQIVEGTVSRNLISMIEHGKTPLLESVAKTIATNINKLIRDKHPSVYIDSDDLLNPSRYQAKNVADIYADKIRNAIAEKWELSDSTVLEIEEFLNLWNLTDKKVAIYELLGDLYYALNDVEKEYLYYNKAFDNALAYKGIREKYKIVGKLIHNCIVSEKNREVIRLASLITSIEKDISPPYLKSIYYNSAIAYKRVREFNNSILSLDKAKHYTSLDETKLLYGIYLLEGNCYKERGEFTKAIECYKEAMAFDLDVESKCHIYTNIIDIYIMEDKPHEYYKYIEEVLKLENNEGFITHTGVKVYYMMGSFFRKLNDVVKAEEYFLKAMELSKKKNNRGLHFKQTLIDLFQLYNQTGDNKKQISLFNSVKEIIDSGHVEINSDTVLLMKYVLLLLEKQDDATAKELILKTIDKGGVLDVLS